MKNKLIYLLGLSVVLTACDVNNELDIIEEATIPEVVLTAGEADFSKYVSIGASFTAGYTDGALFKASQESSFPNILSQKFAMANGGAFTQPLMSDNIGGLLIGGNPWAQPRFYFNGEVPVRLNAAPTTETAAIQAGPYNNMGIPGIKSFHLGVQGYGFISALPNANPYYIRMASAPGASVLQDVLTQAPTFFTLSEIGGNDVLDYALSGGTGTDQTGNFNPATYGGADITDPNVFASVYSNTVDALTANGAKGVVATLPYITDLPFFTVVPNNALVLDAGTAGALTGFFQAVTGIFTQGLLLNNVPLEQAQALAAQYAISFNEGPNRWIIDVPVSASNPLGFRQMTEEELLLLTIDQGALAQGYGSVLLTPQVMQVLGLLQQGGTPTAQQAGLVIAAVNGLDDKDTLDSDELLSIKTATDAYNATIFAVAGSKNLAVVDFSSMINEASAGGLSFDNFTLTTGFVTGGLISLDGIHLTTKGYALMANKFLEAIDMAYGSNFGQATNGLAKPGNYPTHYSPALR